MRKREDIEKAIGKLGDIAYNAGRNASYDDVIVELLLDIREILKGDFRK